MGTDREDFRELAKAAQEYFKADEELEIARSIVDPPTNLFSFVCQHLLRQTDRARRSLQLQRLAMERKNEARLRFYRIIGGDTRREQEAHKNSLDGRPMLTDRFQ